MTYTAKELEPLIDQKKESIVKKVETSFGRKIGVATEMDQELVNKLLLEYERTTRKETTKIAVGKLLIQSKPKKMNGSKVVVEEVEPMPNIIPDEKPMIIEEKIEQVNTKPEIRKVERHRVLAVLPYLPLPMLGLAASYGVYFFSLQFVPLPVAIAEAMAFELTYIGLATLTDLSDEERRKAKSISIGAVFVSVIYNTLAGALHLETGLFLNLHPIWFWVLSVVHGAPLAVLAYLVSDLIFHKR